MARRASSSGIHLNENQVATVKAMLIRGDRQHDIAAWFSVNGGRIAEIARGHRFSDVPPATGNLPPPGPYLKNNEAIEAKLALEKALLALADAEVALRAFTRTAA